MKPIDFGFCTLHVGTFVATAVTILVLGLIQFYRIESMGLDAPLEMFANPSKSPNPPKQQIQEDKALDDMNYEIAWRSQPILGLLMPYEWMFGIFITIGIAVITEILTRRKERRKMLAELNA